MAGHQRPALGVQASGEDGARKGLCWASLLCLCGLLCLPVAVGFPFLLLSHLAKPASGAPEGLRHGGLREILLQCRCALPFPPNMQASPTAQNVPHFDTWPPQPPASVTSLHPTPRLQGPQLAATACIPPPHLPAGTPPQCRSQGTKMRDYKLIRDRI